MAWGPVVVGIDASSAAKGAAIIGERIATVAHVPCQLVHAVRDAWAPLVAVSVDPQVAKMQELQLAVARHQLNELLEGTVADRTLQTLDVRFGPAAVVLQQAVREQQPHPGLIVLGGKHHSTLERWLGGSTSLHVVRSAEVPVLITAGRPTFRRVLVAADLSMAAGPTVGLAERFARLVGAELRLVTVFEQLPDLPGVPTVDPTEYFALAQQTLERDVWPLVKTPRVEKFVRHGHVVETLLREVAEWKADLLVVGSHGKGWAQRVLLGSVTERLINQLPASLLVAPVGVAAATQSQRRERHLELAH